MPTQVIRNNSVKNDDWMKTLPGYKDEVALHDALAQKHKAEEDAKKVQPSEDTPAEEPPKEPE
jgi:hypothetical protein